MNSTLVGVALAPLHAHSANTAVVEFCLLFSQRCIGCGRPVTSFTMALAGNPTTVRYCAPLVLPRPCRSIALANNAFLAWIISLLHSASTSGSTEQITSGARCARRMSSPRRSPYAQRLAAPPAPPHPSTSPQTRGPAVLPHDWTWNRERGGRRRRTGQVESGCCLCNSPVGVSNEGGGDSGEQARAGVNVALGDQENTGSHVLYKQAGGGRGGRGMQRRWELLIFHVEILRRGLAHYIRRRVV